MPFVDVLVHRARPVQKVGGDIVHGRRTFEEVCGTAFSCCVFLPQGTEAATGRGRRVREPTMLFNLNDAGESVALSAEDEVSVVAPELNVAEGRDPDAMQRWQVVGQPQPFGKPGYAIVGFQATIRRVEDD